MQKKQKTLTGQHWHTDFSEIWLRITLILSEEGLKVNTSTAHWGCRGSETFSAPLKSHPQSLSKYFLFLHRYLCICPSCSSSIVENSKEGSTLLCHNPCFFLCWVCWIALNKILLSSYWINITRISAKELLFRLLSTRATHSYVSLKTLLLRENSHAIQFVQWKIQCFSWRLCNHHYSLILEQCCPSKSKPCPH